MKQTVGRFFYGLRGQGHINAIGTVDKDVSFLSFYFAGLVVNFFFVNERRNELDKMTFLSLPPCLAPFFERTPTATNSNLNFKRGAAGGREGPP